MAPIIFYAFNAKGAAQGSSFFKPILIFPGGGYCDPPTGVQVERFYSASSEYPVPLKAGSQGYIHD